MRHPARGSLPRLPAWLAAVAAAFVVGGLAGIARAETGIASVYGYAGSKTASGECAHPSGFTAAHRTLPFNVVIRVTNLTNGKVIRVRVNDRGPYVRPRIIDLSAAAARDLGMIQNGTARVKIEEFESDQGLDLEAKAPGS